MNEFNNSLDKSEMEMSIEDMSLVKKYKNASD
jgi:hypothetical protein